MLENLVSPSDLSQVRTQPNESEIRRGVAPRILMDQVMVTMPYLFDLPSEATNLLYLKTLKEARQSIDNAFESEIELDHTKYFELCVSAHFATCGTPVPTDVDNQIRFRLWHPDLETNEVLRMVELVRKSRHWDTSLVSTRQIVDPDNSQTLSGHNGEWFTIASAAYGALRRRSPADAQALLKEIRFELGRQEKIYLSFKRKKDGVSLLKASALIAHNVGDLIRVTEMWKMDDTDPLVPLANGAMLEARALYKHMMAPECHRYFALRAAKSLRQSPDFLIPIGPFLDDWGRKLVEDSRLDCSDIGDITANLVSGHSKLKNSIGYGRALCGIETHFPGGPSQLYKELPSRVATALKSGELRKIIDMEKPRFEAQWSARALKFVGTLRL